MHACMSRYMLYIRAYQAAEGGLMSPWLYSTGYSVSWCVHVIATIKSEYHYIFRAELHDNIET